MYLENLWVISSYKQSVYTVKSIYLWSWPLILIFDPNSYRLHSHLIFFNVRDINSIPWKLFKYFKCQNADRWTDRWTNNLISVNQSSIFVVGVIKLMIAKCNQKKHWTWAQECIWWIHVHISLTFYYGLPFPEFQWFVLYRLSDASQLCNFSERSSFPVLESLSLISCTV